MKQSVGKMFIKAFIKSIFIVAILLGSAILSFKMISYFMPLTEQETVNILKETKVEPITTTSLDDISKNLILHYDEESGQMKHILLEVYHCEQKKIIYISIPLRTQFTMSETLYRRLAVVYPAIPQIITLSNIPKYFNEETVFEYGSLIIEDLLDIKLSYYTAIPDQVYRTMFTASKNEDKSELTYEMFSKEYRNALSKMKTEEELKDYIEGFYNSTKSNLSLLEKMNYFESYRETSLKDIRFELIAGDNKNSAFVVDLSMAKHQIDNFSTLGYR